MVTDLTAARDEIRAIDEKILRLAARRVALARDVGAAKAESGLPTVDFEQEKRVLDRARAISDETGLEVAVAEHLMLGLIEEAVTAQEGDRIRGSAVGTGQTAVVVGGAGRMGRWLTDYLAAHSYTVHVLDPAAPAEEDRASAALPKADLILVAAPPSDIATLYEGWVDAPPRGLICDVASIKQPFLEPLQHLRAAGARVASIHPMFGPDTRVLRGVDVVIADVGDGADAEAEALFAGTAADILHVPIAEHDVWMADVLALAHATVLAFANALPEEPRPVRSTTLGRLADLAADVTRESPDVYFEIQAGNPHVQDTLGRLAGAVQTLQGLVAAGDRQAFADFMDSGRTRVRRNQGGA